MSLPTWGVILRLWWVRKAPQFYNAIVFNSTVATIARSRNAPVTSNGNRKGSGMWWPPTDSVNAWDTAVNNSSLFSLYSNSHVRKLSLCTDWTSSPSFAQLLHSNCSCLKKAQSSTMPEWHTLQSVLPDLMSKQHMIESLTLPISSNTFPISFCTLQSPCLPHLLSCHPSLADLQSSSMPSCLLLGCLLFVWIKKLLHSFICLLVVSVALHTHKISVLPLSFTELPTRLHSSK